MSIYPVAGRYYAACILFGLLCVHPGGGALYGRTRRYSLVYVSPVQGAMYVHAAETIIMRAVSPVWPGDASRFVRRITGSKSGVHGFTATVSDDDRTVICRPQNPFFPEEEVTVDLDTDIVTYPLPGGVPHAWSFRTGTPGTSMPGLRERLMGSGIPRVLLPVRAPLAAVSAPAPGDPSPPAVHVLFPGQPSTGELYLSNLYWNNYTVQYLLILTNDGTPVFAREMDVDCYDFKPQPNGYSTYYYGQDGFGFFKEMDDTYTVIDSFKCGNGYITDPHDFILLPDGHAMFLGTDPEVIDMSGVVPGGSHAARVIGLVIQELDQSKQVVFQWRSWDHFNITDAWHIALNAS
ncbi:MAG TPA: hypothetical protein VMF59_02200, partial [Bacteroidota bacterium]|nr:hypothetical protein [Bacteroidota bacterium]